MSISHTPSGNNDGRSDYTEPKLIGTEINIETPSLWRQDSWEAHREEVLHRLLKLCDPHTDGDSEIADWARGDLRALESLAREHSFEKANQMPLFAFEYKSEAPSVAQEFYQQLSSCEMTPSSLCDALSIYPACDEAYAIAKQLLRYSPTARALGLSILTELCKEDSKPTSPGIIMATGCLIRWLLEKMPEQDRPLVHEKLVNMFRLASPSFMRMVEQAVHHNEQPMAPCNVRTSRNPPEENPTENRVWNDLITILGRTNTPSSYRILAGAGVSKNLSLESRNLCLDTVIKQPLPGAPALNRFLSKIRSEQDATRREDLSQLLTGMEYAAGGYWEHLTPWTYERPLRILENKRLDPLAILQEMYGSINASAFLFAYNVADGEERHLHAINKAFSIARQSEGDEWIRVELKKGLIKCSFSNPLIHATLLEDLLHQLHLEELVGCFELIEVLGELSTRQRREFPLLALYRLISSDDSLDSKNSLVANWLEETYSHPKDREHASTFLKSAPDKSLLEQCFKLALSDADGWLNDMSWYTDALGVPHKDQLDPFPPSRLALLPVSQFIRAQTVEDTTQSQALLKELGAALAVVNPADRTMWEDFRYNRDNPAVARQLRSLTPQAQEQWRRDMIALQTSPAEEAMQWIGEPQQTHYVALLTDWPEFLFKSGKFPIMTAPCFAFDSGAYYSKALISYLKDAHIKSVLLLDFRRLVQFVAPQLPDTAQRRLLQLEIHQSDLYQHAGLFLQACVSNTIVKLTEDEHSRPFLLLQPSFVRGSLLKQQPNPPTLRFVAGIAAKLGAGVACAFFEPDPITGKPPLIMSGSRTAKALTIPPTRSSGGQLENWDGATWLSTHYGAIEIIGAELLPPPEPHT